MVENIQQSTIRQIVGQSEGIGVIGSPSSTSEIALDILGTASTRKLVGELVAFEFTQDCTPHLALGQLTEVQLRNIWHEDPTMRSLVRQRGRIDAVSERQDTHLGKMAVSAVFGIGGNEYEPSILGTVPPTGTPIYVVSDRLLQTLLANYQRQIFYLGRVYGSSPKLPLWFKHFDKGPDGAGEAYHLGIFGKTGSGKSVLAKMILAAYTRYPQMGILVIDPQGEFSKDIQGKLDTGFAIPLTDLAKKFGRQTYSLTVRKLVLDRWDLFEQILYESPFFEQLSMPKGDNRDTACKNLADRMREEKIKLEDLHERSSFEVVWKLLNEEKFQTIVYRSPGSRARLEKFVKEADVNEFYARWWKPVAELFHKRPGAFTVDYILHLLFDSTPDPRTRPIVVVDLSREQARELTGNDQILWNDRIQGLIIKRLLDGISFQAEQAYKDGQSLNTLVIIDEAHRLAPREMGREEDDIIRSIRATLVDAARTTRKYGLGWLFISQTLSSIDINIVQQLRIFFFGFGLGMGQEFQRLRELVGTSGEALNLYQAFKDPHSTFDIAHRQYSFMTIGPVSPLSFSGTPLFFNAFTNVQEFLNENNLR